MKILENAFTQTDSKILLHNDEIKIEQSKLFDDLSTTTITLGPSAEYKFTARSSMIQGMVGTGTITNSTESFDLNIFNKIALGRGEKVTITNTQDQIPLVVNIISAN